MKKRVVVLGGLILIPILMLAACGGGTTPESTSSVGLSEDHGDALSITAQLALGSLQLEDTDSAIDETQAAELLPLWQAYQSLSTSDKTADAEISAIVKQLQGAMSADQIEAISAMQLTNEDANTWMQEAGGGFGGGSLFGGGKTEGGDGESTPLDDGRIPGSGAGRGQGGGSIPGTAAQTDPDARSTRLAEMGGDAEGFAEMRLEQAMTSTLIRSLQIKTGELDEDDLQARGFVGTAWNVIVESTGIPAETLQAELEQGSTLADAIVAHGGDLESVNAALIEALSQMETEQDQDVGLFVENMLYGTSDPSSDG